MPPRATHMGELTIGEVTITCAVLPDGRRVLSQRGIREALGRRYGGKDFRDDGEDGAGKLPFYLAATSLKSFISDDLLVLGNTEIPFTPAKGGSVALGVDATLLPQICDVWLKAREANVLTKPQLAVAQRAEILMRGLAHVGIVALVDEATGYQRERASDALAAILETFIAKELAAWVKTFDADYYKEMFRLRGMTYVEFSTKRPPLIGKLTNNVVYGRLAPAVLEELQRRNPRGDNGQRRTKHHQWLTPDHGHPKLREHIVRVVTLMQVSQTWDEFIGRLDRISPHYGKTLPLLSYEDSTPKALPAPKA